MLSHSTLLETITAKSASISENFVTQLELQDLQERYNAIKDNALVMGHLSDCESFFFKSISSKCFFQRRSAEETNFKTIIVTIAILINFICHILIAK